MPTSFAPQPADDELECAHCGAIVHYTLTRCPQCGVNLYEPDEAESAASPRPAPNTPSLLAQLKAWVNQLLGRPIALPLPPSAVQTALYRNLLNKTQGDQALAQRLINLEKQRHPRATLTVWLQNAIARWERDNR